MSFTAELHHNNRMHALDLMYDDINYDMFIIEKYKSVINSHGMTSGIESLLTSEGICVGNEDMSDAISKIGKRILEFITNVIAAIREFVDKLRNSTKERLSKWDESLRKNTLWIQENEKFVDWLTTLTNPLLLLDRVKNDSNLAKAIRTYNDFITKKFTVIDSDEVVDLLPNIKTAVGLVNNLELSAKAAHLLERCKSISDPTELDRELNKLRALPEHIFAFQRKLEAIHLKVSKLEVSIDTSKFKSKTGTLKELNLIAIDNKLNGRIPFVTPYKAVRESATLRNHYSELAGMMEYVEREYTGLLSFKKEYEAFLTSDTGKKVADMSVHNEILTSIKYITDFIMNCNKLFVMFSDSMFINGQIQITINQYLNLIVINIQATMRKLNDKQ